MRQNSRLAEGSAAPSRGVVGIIGAGPTLTPSQRKFNQLIERLTRQRQELARWREFQQVYRQQLADHYQPVAARLRDKRIAMVRFLDRTLDGKALSKRERAKVRDMLRQLLPPLLAESQDPELVRLHDKYADQSFGDEQRDHLEVMRTLASEAFGIDVDAYSGGESPEELAHWLDEQMRSAAARPEAQHRPRRKKKTAKTIAREALRERAAEGGTRAVREVFRKLVSELHPDRETDPKEHARKTELMQRVNRAYEAGDLLALLEVQLSIEQIEPAALAGLAEDRLRHYIYVLEEQSRRLVDELEELAGPLAMAMGVSSVTKTSPEAVQRRMEAEIRELKAVVRSLAADLDRFQDLPTFKQSLRDYEIDPFEDDPFEDLAFIMPEEFGPRRRRRGARGHS